MSSNKNKENFMVQGTILAVASLVVRVIGMIYRIPLNRIIGDEGMGLYSCAFEVYNIALLLSSYSLPLAVSKLVSARLAANERKNAYKVFKAALIFAVTVGAIVGLTVFVFAKPIAANIMKSPMSSFALKVLAPCLFIVAVMGVFRGYFQGHGTMVPTAVSQVIEQIVNAIVSITAALVLFKAGAAAAKEAAINGVEHADMLDSAYGASGGTMGTAMGALFGLLFLLFVYVMYKKTLTKQLRSDRTGEEESYSYIFKMLLITILPVVLSSGLYNICGILDQSIFNHIMAWKNVPYKTYNQLIGIYSGKYLLLINVPLAISNALASSSMPSLTKSVTMREKKSVIYGKIGSVIRFSMLIAIPSFVGFAVLGSPILQLLWGDARKETAMILLIGSVCVVFYSLSTITNAVLQGINRMRDPLKNAALSLVIHIVLLVLMLLFGLGIYAVVIANTLFSVTMCIFNQHDINKTIGYRQEYKKTFLLPLISAAIMGAAARGVYFLTRFITGNAIATIISLAAAVGVYVLALIFTGTLTEDDLLEMPKGRTLVRVFRKLHLIR